MVRKNRIKLAKDGAIYHVMTKTVLDQFLFKEASVKEWIYNKILHLSRCYYIDLYAVSVMSNHYHIVLAVRKPTPDGSDIRKRFELLQDANKVPNLWTDEFDRWYEKLTDLSDFMRALNQSISQHINKLRGGSGHVWGKRFLSLPIEDGPGLLACLAYVELNPVRAGLARSPKQYRWCSAGRHTLLGKTSGGIYFPKLGAFSSLRPKFHQKAFYILVHHLALKEKGLESELPNTWLGWEELLKQIDQNQLLEMTFHKTKWAIHSLMLGSKKFCSEIVNQFQLQANNHPKVFEIRPGLFNAKQRIGQFLI